MLRQKSRKEEKPETCVSGELGRAADLGLVHCTAAVTGRSRRAGRQRPTNERLKEGLIRRLGAAGRRAMEAPNWRKHSAATTVLLCWERLKRFNPGAYRCSGPPILCLSLRQRE